MIIKKISILLACLFITMASIAQKANIQSAINYLKENDVEKAKKMIDEAVANESTKTNAKAWMLRGVIYQAIATPAEFMPKLNFILNGNPYMVDLASANSLKALNPNAFSEAIESYKKGLSFDPKYAKEEVLPLLFGLVILGYNSGISQMNASRFQDAIKSFDDVIAVSNIDNGKPFKGNAGYDTIFSNTKLYQANSYYQTGKEDVALPMLEEAIKNPITQNPDVYVMITDIYDKNNEAKWLETMKIAKAKYPGDKRILNNEINYYLKKGRGEESVAKLKEGIAADPTKVDLYVILGQTYYNMANPTDKDGKATTPPANAAELEQNALANYAKALELDKGNNAYAQFYTGIVHYNAAKVMTDIMNKEKDDNKYKEMEPKRNYKLEQAIPFLLKAKSLIEAEGLSEGNKTMYKQVLSGLEQSYMITDKPEKSTEMHNLLNSVK